MMAGTHEGWGKKTGLLSRPFRHWTYVRDKTFFDVTHVIDATLYISCTYRVTSTFSDDMSW